MSDFLVSRSLKLLEKVLEMLEKSLYLSSIEKGSPGYFNHP